MPIEIELRHLRYFAAVAEEMHFGRAAERLHIAQPSLSQQIRKLEQMIGTELIDRSQRSIGLTPAGEALASRTGRAFEGVEAALVAARDAADGLTGRFAVGFVETAAISIVPTTVRNFRATHPRIILELRELPVRAQVEELIRGHLDLGFVRTEPGHDDLVVEKVIEEHYIAALPEGHWLAGRESLAPEELLREPLVVIEREQIPGLYDETMAIAHQFGTAVRIAQTANSILSILGLVSAGLGLALLPDSIRGLVFGVEYVSLDPAPRTAILAVRHEDHRSPQLDPFLESLTGSR